MDNFYLPILVLIAFLTRYMVRSNSKFGYTNDVYFHLSYAELIRNNGFRWKERFDHLKLNHLNSYPYLFHLFVAYSSKILGYGQIERIISAFFDASNSIIVFVILTYSFQDYELIFLLSILYIMTPALVGVRIGPRAYNGSPRVFGQTIFLLHILFLILVLNYYPTEIWPYFVLVISSLPILLVSKFSIQSFLFIGVGICFFMPFYIITLILTFALGCASKRLPVRMILLGAFEHLEFYFKVLSKITIESKPNFIKQTIFYFKKSIYLLFTKPLDFLKWIYRDCHYKPHVFIFIFPVYFVSLVYILLNFQSFLIETADSYIFRLHFAVSVSGLFIFLLISFKKLSFLGESERYLEFTLPSAILIFGYGNDKYSSIIILLLICYQALVYFYYYIYLHNSYFKSLSSEYIDLEKSFSQIKSNLLLSSANCICMDHTRWITLFFFQILDLKNARIISTGDPEKIALAKALSDRAQEAGFPAREEGRIRGHDDKNDAYYIYQIRLEMYLPDGFFRNLFSPTKRKPKFR